jgi:hypothetical protein
MVAFRNPGVYYKAESFCVFPLLNEGQIFNVLRFENKTFDDSPIVLDDGFMLEEALGQVRIDVTQHIEKNYSDKEFLLLPPGEWNLQEVGIEFLALLQVRQSAGFLWDIQNKTDCEDLRNTIEPIFKLPKISRQPILNRL